jgi:HK97 family phage portal protein
VILDTTNGVISVVAHPRRSTGAYAQLAQDTFAGRIVRPESALSLASVYGAVSLVSNTIGSMPLQVINELGGRREVVGGAQVALMLRYQPNPEMTGAALWTTVAAHLLLRGNAYLVKIRNSAGVVTELWPINPANVTPYRGGVNGEKVFRVRIYTGDEAVEGDMSSRDILHIMGPSFDDGVQGASPIAVLRQRIGVQVAQSEYQGRFYQQGMSIKGVLSTPEKLGPEAAQRIKDQWNTAYGGMDNSHSIAVLHSGTQFQQVSLSPEDAQFIETMRWGHTEVATAFGIPASRLNGEGSSLTYSNQGQDDLFYYKQGVLPRLTTIEQSLNMDPDLFGYQSSWVPRFNADALLRADIETRFRVYEQGRGMGVFSANDIRAAEGLSPVSGGDDYTPTSMGSVTTGDGAGDGGVRGVQVRGGLMGDDEAVRPVVRDDYEDDAALGVGVTRPAQQVVLNVPEVPAPHVTVNIPNQPVPIVNVAAPEVHVDVQPPDVRIDAPVTVEAAKAPDVRVEPNVVIELPPMPDAPMASPKSVSFERDRSGRIVGAEIVEE